MYITYRSYSGQYFDLKKPKNLIRHTYWKIILNNETIGSYPNLFELNIEQIRELPMYSYRVIYEVKKTDIFILALVHKRRDLQPEDIEIRT